ncbi:uncharacterized mitochondrial protein AtMg00810-like [Beta vulgaris subsp. vulgaris]|uniref:uncharacterized mitochondrial protein AtMg00810-like n=1 Tax=Beta vulgaris subsp. vulgaris TaxID=3555 RepID=UPI002036DABD|nr:uncharacterized mitochondrial protein AtMg00810-like [Beta vulgaris subsp. vulgaris]
MGFVITNSESSLFTYSQGLDRAYLLLYVDDIILTTSSDGLHKRIITQLKTEFPRSDLEPLSYFLGIAVSRTPTYTLLSQQNYAQEVLGRAGMRNCKLVATPVDTKSKLSADSGPNFQDSTKYHNLVGALQYLTFTRPDIAYAVQHVCLFMHDSRESHYDALERILRYI